jgi:hypothetical protein
MAKTKPPTTEKSPQTKFWTDGFWTMELPAGKPFSLEWIKTQLLVVPYGLFEMTKMSLSVSQWDALFIALATIVRAFLDSAGIHAYTLFVNAVFLSRLVKQSLLEGSRCNHSTELPLRKVMFPSIVNTDHSYDRSLYRQPNVRFLKTFL